MRKYLLIILLFCPFVVFAQKLDSILMELQQRQDSISNQINKLFIKNYEIDTFVKNRLRFLNERAEISEKHVSSLQDIFSSSTDWIGTRLNAFAFIFAIFSIFFAWYVAKKGDEISRIEEKVREAQKDVELLNKQLVSNVKLVYDRLKEQEYIDIVSQVSEKPSMFKNHLSRLLTLNVPQNDYYTFCNILSKAAENTNGDDDSIEYLLIYLSNRYPLEIVNNISLLNLFVDNWGRFFWGVEFENIKKIINRYVEVFLNKEYLNAGRILSLILKPIAIRYNSMYLSKEILFENRSDDERFRILDMLIKHEVGEFYIFYKGFMSIYTDGEMFEKLSTENKELVKRYLQQQ